MKSNKIPDDDVIIYSLSLADLETVSEDTGIKFTKADIRFISDRIDDYIGNGFDAIETALNDLKEMKKEKRKNKLPA